MISVLYDTFKHWSDGGSVYIISDPHFNDPESFEFRKAPGKFPDNVNSPSALADYQVREINKVCSKQDCLICLGDVGDISYVKKLRAKHKVLILGNHDRGASYYKKECYRDIKTNVDLVANTSWDSLLKAGYKYVTTTPCGPIFEKVTDNGLFDEVYAGPLMISDKILLSHEPIIPCPSYIVNLCGHVHANPHVFKVNDCTYYNFCAEAIDYRPKSLAELIKHGLLSGVPDIHAVTVAGAVARKRRKEKAGK